MTLRDCHRPFHPILNYQAHAGLATSFQKLSENDKLKLQGKYVRSGHFFRGPYEMPSFANRFLMQEIALTNERKGIKN